MTGVYAGRQTRSRAFLAVTLILSAFGICSVALGVYVQSSTGKAFTTILGIMSLIGSTYIQLMTRPSASPLDHEAIGLSGPGPISDNPSTLLGSSSIKIHQNPTTRQRRVHSEGAGIYLDPVDVSARLHRLESSLYSGQDEDWETEEDDDDDDDDDDENEDESEEDNDNDQSDDDEDPREDVSNRLARVEDSIRDVKRHLWMDDEEVEDELDEANGESDEDEDEGSDDSDDADDNGGDGDAWYDEGDVTVDEDGWYDEDDGSNSFNDVNTFRAFDFDDFNNYDGYDYA